MRLPGNPLRVVPVLAAAVLFGACSRPARVSIATQGVASTRAAARLLKEGGNLVDAAVAASFVISVERPHSTGIGGGGFWVSYHAASKSWLALDFRERAPAGIRLPEKLLKEKPEAILPLLQDTPLGGGIPGLVAGLGWVHARQGKLPWKQVLQPAIELAEQGFTVYPALALALADRRDVLAGDADATRIFLRPDGSALKSGDLLRQPELGVTLRQIAAEGSQGFYTGRLSRTLSSALRRMGSPITAQDLSKYRVIERKPVRAEVMGRKIVLMPPPSSGGILIPQILGLLDPDLKRLRQAGLKSEYGIHRTAQAMQVAFSDRARYLGDPAFTRLPQDWLLSSAYLDARRRRYMEGPASEKALPATEILPEGSNEPSHDLGNESNDTTHLSLMDREGNAIATTQSINGWMGSGQVISGTGILLNNTMDDFSVATGVRNLYGAVGGAPNRIEPGKTPLSSMTPTIVVERTPDGEDRPVLAIGAPGGTRIITCIAQTLLSQWIDGRSLGEAVSAPRVHQQWIPDELVIEEAPPEVSIPAAVDEGLRRRGHKVRRGEVHCRVMAASLREAVSDPRDFGSALLLR